MTLEVCAILAHDDCANVTRDNVFCDLFSHDNRDILFIELWSFQS